MRIPRLGEAHQATGANPDDIPVEQVTKFMTIINLKVARAFSVEVPMTLLARATR